MRYIFLLVILAQFLTVHGQSEVLIGDSIVETSLKIRKGGLVIGDLTSPNPKSGSIKFKNGTFMGFDGSDWVSLSPQEKYILGESNILTDGSIEFGALTGIEAATAICQDSYPNEPTAHFYTAEEIDAAIGFGNINGIVSNTKYWTIIHLFLGFDLNNTKSNNCYSLLTHHGGLAKGTTVEIVLNATAPGGLVGNYSNYQNGENCNVSRAFICGK